MSNKEIESKDIETKEEVSVETEAEATVETTEKESTKDKGLYLRIGAFAMFIGVAALIMGSVWSNNSGDLTAWMDSDSDSVVETETLSTLETLSTDHYSENTLMAPVQGTHTAQTIPAKNNAAADFAKTNAQAFKTMQNQQRDILAHNLQAQRERLQASFARADEQRQQMRQNIRQTQLNTFKQDPMAEVMETHRVEMMKLMEERRQKFINEMNQAYTTRS